MIWLTLRAAWASDALDAESLARAVDEILPLVELHAGRRFVTKPQVTLADGASFAAVVAEENRLIYDRVFAASPEAVRHKLADDSAWSTQHMVLGKYGILNDTLYMSPEPLRAAAAQLPGDRLHDVVRVILAHELTHALQDQHTPFDGLLAGVRDQDHLWASSGSWEGFATWVEQKVAHDLGLDDVFWSVAGLQGWGPDGLTNPMSFQTWAVYGQGRRFVEHHAAAGPEHLWSVLGKPPQRTGMLFRPADYTASPPPPPVDFSPALAGAEAKLTSQVEWASMITTLGDLELRGEAILGHTEAELDELMAHLVYAQKLEGTLPDRGVEARILLFDDEAWPKRYLDLLRAQASAEADRKGEAYDVPIEVSYEPYPLPDLAIDDSTMRTTRIPIGGGRHLEARAAWVVRGRVVLVVTAERFRPGLRMNWAIAHLLAGLESVPLP
jgi:hypothetical protein